MYEIIYIVCTVLTMIVYCNRDDYTFKIIFEIGGGGGEGYDFETPILNKGPEKSYIGHNVLSLTFT